MQKIRSQITLLQGKHRIRLKEMMKYYYPLGSDKCRSIQICTAIVKNTAYQEVVERLKSKSSLYILRSDRNRRNSICCFQDKLPIQCVPADHYMGGEIPGNERWVFRMKVELAPEYAPDYYKILQNDEEFYRNQQIMTDIWYLLTLTSLQDPPYRRWVLNQALLDELDYEIPRTIDQFEEMFDKMQAKGITPTLLDRSGYEVQLMGMYDLYFNKDIHFYKWERHGKICTCCKISCPGLSDFIE